MPKFSGASRRNIAILPLNMIGNAQNFQPLRANEFFLSSLMPNLSMSDAIQWDQIESNTDAILIQRVSILDPAVHGMGAPQGERS